MKEQMLKIDFSYTDEFGQEIRVVKHYTDAALIDRNWLEFLLDEFKLFLVGSGFDCNSVDKIQLVED